MQNPNVVNMIWNYAEAHLFSEIVQQTTFFFQEFLRGMLELAEYTN